MANSTNTTTKKKKPMAGGGSSESLSIAMGITPPQFGSHLTEPGSVDQQLSIAQAQISQLPLLNSATHTAGTVQRNREEQQGAYQTSESAGAMQAGSIAEKMKNATAKNSPGKTKKQIFG